MFIYSGSLDATAAYNLLIIITHIVFFIRQPSPFYENYVSFGSVNSCNDPFNSK